MSDKKNAKKLLVEKADIEFKNVSFSYGQKISGLKDISISIKQGEKLRSRCIWSRKIDTTLLLPSEEGSVLINKNDVRDLTQESLRHHIECSLPVIT